MEFIVRANEAFSSIRNEIGPATISNSKSEKVLRSKINHDLEFKQLN